MKSGNLNFLEPSGPLHACNGTDLPLHRRPMCAHIFWSINWSWSNQTTEGATEIKIQIKKKATPGISTFRLKKKFSFQFFIFCTPSSFPFIWAHPCDFVAFPFMFPWDASGAELKKSRDGLACPSIALLPHWSALQRGETRLSINIRHVCYHSELH